MSLFLWNVVEDDERDDTLHVFPVADIRAHVATGACWCNPRRDAYGYGAMIVHNGVTEPQQIH